MKKRIILSLAGVFIFLSLTVGLVFGLINAGGGFQSAKMKTLQAQQ